MCDSTRKLTPASVLLEYLVDHERAAKKAAVQLAQLRDMCRFCQTPVTEASLPFHLHFGTEHACNACFTKEYQAK